VIFLQRPFTSLVHAHAGRTQAHVVGLVFRCDPNQPQMRALVVLGYFSNHIRILILNSFTRWIILAVLILAAIACYSYGNSTGLFVFIVVGVIVELAFWFGVFSKKDNHSSS
jgi:membrane protein implicated in regulation of membrane protease activity